MFGKFITAFLLLSLLALSQAKLTVHEWGTYTSLQGSKGLTTPGMHHGEEALPEFVWSRAMEPEYVMTLEEKRGILPPPLTQISAKCGFCEVMDWKAVAGTETEVTQKLETPVIYFYSDEAIENLEVTVDFPQGIVTEVYPRTSANLPAPGAITATAGGSASWEVSIAAPEHVLEVPFVTDEDIWAPSRRVDANMVTNLAHPDENEHHIFYRGLGRFDGPVSVSSDYEELTVTSTSSEDIPFAWLMVSDGHRGFVRPLGPVPAGESVSTPLADGSFDLDPSSNTEVKNMVSYLESARMGLLRELQGAGLTELESIAMVDTWETSYFRKSGARVLYIAPASYPDEVLPWKMNPQPEEEVRVLVGRVEIITKREEDVLRNHALALFSKQQTSITSMSNEEVANHRLEEVAHINHIKSSHRFAEAKLRRALADILESDAQMREDVENFVFEHLVFEE